MASLLETLQTINARARARMAADKSLWIGILTEDLDHWHSMDVFTAADLDAYFDAEYEKECRKARF